MGGVNFGKARRKSSMLYLLHAHPVAIVAVPHELVVHDVALAVAAADAQAIGGSVVAAALLRFVTDLAATDIMPAIARDPIAPRAQVAPLRELLRDRSLNLFTKCERERWHFFGGNQHRSRASENHPGRAGRDGSARTRKIAASATNAAARRGDGVSAKACDTECQFQSNIREEKYSSHLQGRAVGHRHGLKKRKPLIASCKDDI